MNKMRFITIIATSFFTVVLLAILLWRTIVAEDTLKLPSAFSINRQDVLIYKINQQTGELTENGFRINYDSSKIIDAEVDKTKQELWLKLGQDSSLSIEIEYEDGPMSYKDKREVQQISTNQWGKVYRIRQQENSYIYTNEYSSDPIACSKNSTGSYEDCGWHSLPINFDPPSTNQSLAIFYITCSSEDRAKIEVCDEIVKTLKIEAVNPQDTPLSITPTSNQLEKNRIESGIKFSENDIEPKVRISALVPANTEVNDTVGYPTTLVFANGSDKLILAIEHGAVEVPFSSAIKITENYYRAVTKNGEIIYVDSPRLKGICEFGTEKVNSPCGYPTLEGLNVSCSGREAITYCDEIVKSLLIR